MPVESFEPIGRRIVIAPRRRPEAFHGVYLPAKEEVPVTGIVVGGSAAAIDACPVAPGMQVVVNKYKGTSFQINRQWYYAFEPDDVLAYLVEVPDA